MITVDNDRIELMSLDKRGYILGVSDYETLSLYFAVHSAFKLANCAFGVNL